MARKKRDGAGMKTRARMLEEHERKRAQMEIAEIQELMDRKGWSQGRLARELDLTPGAVSYWMSEDSVPSGPARKQMRAWLEEARASGEDARKNPVVQSA